MELVNSLGGAPSNQSPSTDEPVAWAISLETLYVEHFGRLVEVARRIVQDRALAEECVQDVFLSYHVKQPVHAPGKAAAYLRSMTRNAAISKVRREARQRRELPGATNAAPAAEETALAELAVDELVGQIVELSQRQRQVVSCSVRGLSVNETADVLAISSGSVKTHRSRAASHLRNHLDAPLAA